MEIIIGHTDLIAVVEKAKGLDGANTGKIGCTAPWSRLQRVGLSGITNEKTAFAGKIELVIGQGGIRNKNVTKFQKSIFKKEVFPSIVNFAPACGDTFNIILDYKNDLLFAAKIVYAQKTNKL